MLYGTVNHHIVTNNKGAEMLKEQLEIGADIIAMERGLNKLAYEADAELEVLGNRTGLNPKMIKAIVAKALSDALAEAKLHLLLEGN